MKKYCLTVLAIALYTFTFSQVPAGQPLQPLMQAYFQLTDALAKDQSDRAQSAAGSMHDEIKKVSMGSLSEGEHKVWMHINKKLLSDAEHISTTTDIEHQRDHFATLSDGITKLMKAGNNQPSDLYVQFCPMAEGGKGAYWISEQQKISNPYMGKRMPSCGKTAEVLKSKD